MSINDIDLLKQDIFGILKTPEYDISIKMYDKNGKLTTNIDNVLWFYINPYDCLIRLPLNDEYIVKFWKNKNTIFQKDVLRIMKRLKNISNFRSYTFNVKIFNKQVNIEKQAQDKDVIEESFEPLSNYVEWINNYGK